MAIAGTCRSTCVSQNPQSSKAFQFIIIFIHAALC